MRRVTFLSTNPPGQRMGMGQYERLISHHLRAAVAEVGSKWEFHAVFDGRPRGGVALGDLEGSIVKSGRRMGVSTQRMSRIPWALAKSASSVLAGPRPNLYHSLSLGFPAPSNAPAVYTIHDLPPERFADEGRLPKWARSAARSAAMIVTPSLFAKQEIVSLLGVDERRVRVVQNGCEVDVFRPDVPSLSNRQRQELGLDDRPYLLYSGGATRRKNVSNLLAAWPRIKDEMPDLQLAMAGPGPQLQSHVEKASQQNDVVVLGYMSRDWMPSLMRSAELLVCPSVYEGFGLPPLEALATGTPVVAVHQGAIPEVVGDLAKLAPDGSPSALTDWILSAMHDRSYRDNVAVRGPLHARAFSWDIHAKNLLGVYEEVAQ